MQKEIDRLINSYRNNALSREEAGMLAGWLEESDEHRAQFREGLAGREQPASATAEREWARFATRNKILFAVPEGVNTRRRLFRRYVAAAAVLAAGICAVWFWQGVPAVPDAGNGTEIGAVRYSSCCTAPISVPFPASGTAGTPCQNQTAQMPAAKTAAAAT